MRIANLEGRLVLVQGGGTLDVERASGGRFGPDPQAIYDEWDAFVRWAEDGRGEGSAPEPSDGGRLEAPVPRPRQVFAVGLNYSEHATETGFQRPDAPMVFTKFPSSITGPEGEILLPPGSVDWEVELVAVIGRRAFRIDDAEAADHVAGLTCGQDISERGVQLAGSPPQFSLGKSFPTFSPIGPHVVTLDEVQDDLRLTCTLNGEVVQDAWTHDMLFSLSELIARISFVCPLLPGDLLFTGTPPGVGMGRRPPRYLAAGDRLVTAIEGVGEMSHHVVADPSLEALSAGAVPAT